MPPRDLGPLPLWLYFAAVPMSGSTKNLEWEYCLLNVSSEDKKWVESRLRCWILIRTTGCLTQEELTIQHKSTEKGLHAAATICGSAAVVATYHW